MLFRSKLPGRSRHGAPDRKPQKNAVEDYGSLVNLNMPCQAPFYALSRLGHQPIAKRLHAGPPHGTWRIDNVIGETGRQAEFERPHQPACGKVVRNQGAAAEHDALAPDCSLDRVIGRQKRRTAVRVDIIDPGTVQPHGPIDSENVMQERMASEVGGVRNG